MKISNVAISNLIYHKYDPKVGTADITLDIYGETKSVRKSVLKYYRRKRLTEELYNTFCKDMYGHIELFSDNNDEIRIERVN